jgi:hypothetical protein
MTEAAAETPGGGGNTAPHEQEYAGGAAAPASGRYESINLFGRRTGHRITAQRGEALPPLPRGFAWVVADAESNR